MRKSGLHHAIRTAFLFMCATLLRGQEGTRVLGPAAHVYATHGGVAWRAHVFRPPALDLERDAWPQKLLGARAQVVTISPAAHVRKGLPPTLILQGRTDTVTPLKGARLFYERMRAAGNVCELQVYDGTGHIFTPSTLRDDGWPQPDPKIQAEAFKRPEEFLAAHGFIMKPAAAKN